jgi:glycosyltransferase involved in cell wall biosynthesis
MKQVFVSWEKYNRRSALFADNIGAEMHHIAVGQRGNVLQAPFRYLVQGLRTWKMLRRDKPDVIFCQNPPIFLVLVAYLYARRYGAQYVIDSHSSTFLAPKWRWALPLHRPLSRAAVTTIVTNQHLKELVSKWGCHAMTVGFIPGEFPDTDLFPFDHPNNVVVVSSFEWDEPLDVVFQAAAELPNVHFYVTGNNERAAPELLALKPDNCTLTGYLPDADYVALLRSADLVVDLVSQDHTLLLGAFEAVSLGTPLMVSDWPVLREYFDIGTVHVPNTVAGVRDGVKRALKQHSTLQEQVLVLRDRLEADWETKRGEIAALLDQT